MGYLWYLSMFVNCLPRAAALAVWDGVIHEGLHVFLPVTVAILEALKYALLAQKFEDILAFLKTTKWDQQPEEDARLVGRLLMRKSARVASSSSVLSNALSPLRL